MSMSPWVNEERGKIQLFWPIESFTSSVEISNFWEEFIVEAFLWKESEREISIFLSFETFLSFERKG